MVTYSFAIDEKLSKDASKLLEVKDGDIEELLKASGVTMPSCQEILEKIHDWYDKQPHLPAGKLENRLALWFFVQNGFSIEKSKEKIDNYYTSKHKVSEFITKRDPLSPELSKCFENGLWIVLPKKTDDNRRVIIYRNKPVQVEISPVDILKMTFMIGEYRLMNDCVDGEHWIIDMSAATLQMTLQWTPMLIAKTAFYLKSCLPPKLKGLHLVNMPSFADTAVNLFKKTMTAKVSQRVFTYKKFDEIFEKFPKSMFPKDFGGEGVDSKEITDAWLKTMQSPAWRQWFLDQDEILSDESKRLTLTKIDEIFGVEGSFKKLDID